MPRRVAFLGGINVGGHRVTMDRLRAAFEALGFTSVSTFIASGNVIFDAKEAKTRKMGEVAIERVVEARLAKELGYAVPTFVRTVSDVIAIAAHAPFGALVEHDTQLVALLRARPAPAAKKATEALSNGTDSLVIRNAELYWRIHGKTMDSSLKGSVLSKAIQQPFTVRNVTSLRKLVATLASGS